MASTTRRKKPPNGLSLELMDAMVREYGEWQARVLAQDPTLPPALSDDDKYMLESHRIPVATVHRLRKLIFEDLVRRGFQQSEVCHRLLVSRKTYSRLALSVFGVDDPKLIRAQCTARNLEYQGKIKSEIDRMDKMRLDRKAGDRIFTSAERDAYFKLIKLGNELDESLREMHAADAPEQVEVKETHTYAISLDVRGTREELADILEANIIDVPALPAPSPETADGS